MNSKFSIGVVVAIVLQVSGFVWWTAQQAQTINILSVKVAALTSSASVVETTNVRRDIRELQNILKALPEVIRADLLELEDELAETSMELRTELSDMRKELRKKRKNNTTRKEIRSDLGNNRNGLPEDRKKRRKLDRKALKNKS